MTAPVLSPGISIGAARRHLAELFRSAGLDSPELDARLLVGHALGLDQAALISASTRALDDAQRAALAALAAKRLRREPVARILGTKEFWGQALRVSDATLVPRPETETLVEAALAAIGAGGPLQRPLRIADLGTGTGALLLALLSELPQASGVGTDIERSAIETARDNAAALGLSERAAFVVSDFGAALGGGFDLIVCNPPYIATGELAHLPPEVLSDPPLALDGGADGLTCHRRIAGDTRRLLNRDGWLVVELGLGQEAAVAALLTDAGLAPQPARRDLAGIPRALAASATITP